MSHSLETLYRVYDDGEGVCLEVRPHPDFPEGTIEVHSNANQGSKEFYGPLSICLVPSQARLLAKALNAVADSLEQKP